MEEELKQMKTLDYINNLIDSYQEQVHTPRTDSPDSYAAKNWWDGFCFAIDAAVNICSSRESDGSHVSGEDIEKLMKQLQKGLVYSEEWGKRKQMEKTCLSAEQTMQIVFNRPIDSKNDRITLGGMTVRLKDGQEITYDFNHYEGNVSKKDPKILEVSQNELDTEDFPGSKKLIGHLLEVVSIESLLVYIESDNDELEPLRIENHKLQMEEKYPMWKGQSTQYVKADYDTREAENTYQFTPEVLSLVEFLTDE